MRQEATQLSTSLADLSAGSLQVLAVFAMLVGYPWLLAVVWPITGGTATYAALRLTLARPWGN